MCILDLLRIGSSTVVRQLNFKNKLFFVYVLFKNFSFFSPVKILLRSIGMFLKHAQSLNCDHTVVILYHHLNGVLATWKLMVKTKK